VSVYVCECAFMCSLQNMSVLNEADERIAIKLAFDL